MERLIIFDKLLSFKALLNDNDLKVNLYVSVFYLDPIK